MKDSRTSPDGELRRTVAGGRPRPAKETAARSGPATTREGDSVQDGHTLEARGVSLGYGERDIVKDLDVTVPRGRISVIVGPNACGKSTLLRAMARLLAPTAGQVLLDGRDIQHTPTKEVAALLGILPQSPIAPEGITVSDLVGRGRYPHQGWFRRWTAEDDAAVAEALLATDVLDLADRPVDELSGGQRQRVWIAMALSQRTDILLLDEPTTFLDVSHQLDVLDLLTDLNRERGVTLVAVLHDLNLACRYADHLIAMKDGQIVAEGDPTEIVDEELVGEVFGMRCKVIDDPASATPVVVPLGRHHVAPQQ
ncbi:putative siderophore transport system ATP-binding protein YusV [Streptomyces sp. YIM 130001]|uniref:ABC transporter ATP-binding protein n=1 Tax=Streptomyces sp. YIM 130001 TaxID=2259644 RepID=UPI000E65E8E5|nr:ABC transporter ATP-binding protein [Streptomyces sp. YIM 130001]RII14764.1 putative siderophore transport system ATP-binding protein YusV [Streptomyces sp. YIM 130001]